MGTGYIKIILRFRREKKNTIDNWLSRETLISPEMSDILRNEWRGLRNPRDIGDPIDHSYHSFSSIHTRLENCIGGTYQIPVEIQMK